MLKQIKWQSLEKLVRNIAEAKFGATARAEDVGGVKCDCVLHLEGDVVIVEISKETTLDKLREDLAKFNVIRPYFFQRNIFPRCYFVSLSDPTPSLIEAGKTQYVKVLSVVQFVGEMLGRNQYATLRRAQPFGSAIDIVTGDPDSSEYIPVSYYTDDGETLTVADICTQLSQGKTLVLAGDYGSGKSRCVKEVYESLMASYATNLKSPIAINLRDNWGLNRAPEIINRHFTDLGLGASVADVLKTAFENSTVYLLDGFDEIGAQA